MTDGGPLCPTGKAAFEGLQFYSRSLCSGDEVGTLLQLHRSGATAELSGDVLRQGSAKAERSQQSAKFGEWAGDKRGAHRTWAHTIGPK